MNTAIRRVLTATTLALTLATSALVAAPGFAATPDRSPFYVNSVDVAYLESFPVQVQLLVSGNLPTPCHEPAWTVSDDGSFVIVELWSEADPDVICTAVLEEAELTIPVGDYEEAQRAVIVNDRLSELITVGEPTGDETRLVAAGWSFGMCAGYCRADLTVIGDRLRLQGSDNWTDTPLYVNEGTLTADGASTLSTLLADIQPASLDETYGCPDCADGGAAYVGFLSDGQGSRHDMPFGDPPPVLASLYELNQSLISALETCTSNELVGVDADCSPYEGD